ncbi:hypothetical protein FSP39_021231 [Pinctada imbricata]|uniref:Phospholipase A2 n=1 Tax=Pinctada imbricata TaxID=66713 RepID=A0AA88Y152_PINIB|nr:hypothetical protein FSP39_021231 [Pinctada imbricata]
MYFQPNRTSAVFRFGDDVNYMRPSLFREPLVRKIPYNPVTVKAPEKVSDDVFVTSKSPKKVKRMSLIRAFDPYQIFEVSDTILTFITAIMVCLRDSPTRLTGCPYKRAIRIKLMALFNPHLSEVYKVEHRPCLILNIKVLQGRNISKGWMDYVDTPDPYVKLHIRTAPEGRRQTTVKDNDVNPLWNEEFIYLLDEQEENKLHITLMESNYGNLDQTIGEAWYDLTKLPRDKKVKETFIFNETSEVDIEFEISLDKDPTLRYSLCLCDDEKNFREVRREKCYQAMRDLLGDERGPDSMDSVPTVGVIGSGGGFRAMVGMSGVIKALSDSGILDCCAYVCGLSGSSWYISTLYSHHDWPEMKPGDMQEELKNNIDSSLVWLLSPQSIYRYLDRILQKRKAGQPISFTDIFGHLVGETLLKDRLDFRLTDVREKVEEGQAPLPLLTCVNVKADRSARSFQEWVEFSPYEIGMPKYGTFMQTEQFGCKFFMGKLCKKYEEPPLHFLQGIWGSAFCILFKRLLEDNRKLDPVEMIRQEMVKQLEANYDDESSDSSDDEDVVTDTPSEESDTGTKEDKFTFKDSDIAMMNGKGGARKMPGKQMSRGTTVRRTKQKGYWQSFLTGILENKKFEMLNSRAGRAGVIHNFMRGLSLQHTYALSPFTPGANPDEKRVSDDFDGLHEMHPTSVKHLYMVDAGLTFNSPYPLVLRPQRSVDIILSFDFSARPSDSTPPFKELLLAEKWARMNKLAFPPIDTTVFDREGLKELYIFKHPTDPYCPIILHFCLVNIEFRKYKRPGIPRETKEEKEFANFDIFDDPQTPYSTFNFKYTHEAFERLSKLTEFNTLLNVEEIKSVLKETIEKKKAVPPKMPISLNEVKNLRRVSVKNKNRLSSYLSSILDRKRNKSGSDIFSSSDDDSKMLSKSANDVCYRNMKSRSRVTFNKTKRVIGSKNFERTSATPSLTSPLEDEEEDVCDGPVRVRTTKGRKSKKESMFVTATEWDDPECHSDEDAVCHSDDDDNTFFDSV